MRVSSVTPPNTHNPARPRRRRYVHDVALEAGGRRVTAKTLTTPGHSPSPRRPAWLHQVRKSKRKCSRLFPYSDVDRPLGRAHLNPPPIQLSCQKSPPPCGSGPRSDCRRLGSKFLRLRGNDPIFYCGKEMAETTSTTKPTGGRTRARTLDPLIKSQRISQRNGVGFF